MFPFGITALQQINKKLILRLFFNQSDQHFSAIHHPGDAQEKQNNNIGFSMPQSITEMIEPIVLPI